MREARGKPLPGRLLAGSHASLSLHQGSGPRPGRAQGGDSDAGAADPPAPAAHTCWRTGRAPDRTWFPSFGCRGPGCVQCHPSAVGTPD